MLNLPIRKSVDTAEKKQEGLFTLLTLVPFNTNYSEFSSLESLSPSEVTLM